MSSKSKLLFLRLDLILFFNIPATTLLAQCSHIFDGFKTSISNFYEVKRDKYLKFIWNKNNQDKYCLQNLFASIAEVIFIYDYTISGTGNVTLIRR